MGEKSSSTGSFGIPTQPHLLVSVTSGAANTYGTYTQMLASTSAAIYLTHVVIRLSGATVDYVAIAIGTGAGGSEVKVGEVILLGVTAQSSLVIPIFPRIPVATTTRIAVKTADDAGTQVCVIGLIAINQANVVDDGVAESGNVIQWNGSAVATPNVAGIPKVDITQVNGAAPVADSGTAQAATATTLTLRAGAPATDTISGKYILIDSATTGAGQFAFCTAYNTSTKVAAINGWSGGVTPTGTITYTVPSF